MHKLLSILLLVFISHFLEAQSYYEQIDSLNRLIATSQNPIEKFKLTKKVGELYWSFKTDSAIIVFQKAQEEALKLNNMEWFYEFVTEEGCSNQYYKSESVRALELFLKSIELAEGLKDEKKICRCNFLISAAHLKNETWDKAEEYLKRTVKCKRKLKDWSLYFTSLKNLGIFYLNQGKLDTAETILRQAKEEQKPYVNDRYNWVLINIKLIETLYRKNNIHEAVALNNALEKYGLENANVEPEALARHYLTMSRISNDVPNWINYQKALVYAERALSIDTSVVNDKLIAPRANLNKAVALFNSGKQKEGYDLMSRTYEELNILKDARFNYLIKEKTSKLQAQYDIDKEHKYAVQLRKERWYQLILLGFGVILLGLLSLYVVSLIKNNKIKQAKNALLEAQNEEITHQKNLLEEQKRELEQLNKSKDQLFSILSHDLRSPIGALKSTLGLLNDDIIQVEDFKRISVKLERDVENTYNLLEELLEWSYSQMKGIEPQKALLDLEDLLAEKIELYKDNMQSKNITFSLLSDDELNVYADKNQLGIVVSNLLSNAIKFTPVGGKISIESHEYENNIEMKIKDSGIGIPSESMGNIFDTQSSLRRKGTAGENSTGLGLKLCKAMIEKNNGTICVESEVGKGTTFTIVIPKK
jgi:two-component system, sensor histidine kinase and response regulator